MMISDGKLHHSTGVRSAPISTPGLCWAIEVREFPAGQSHVGGTEGHRFYRGKKPKKSGWKPHVAKIQVFRVWFLSIHSSRLFFHPIFRSEDHWGFLSVRDPQRRLVTEILMSGMDMDGQWWTCFMTSLMPSPDFLKDPGESGADEQFFLLLS